MLFASYLGTFGIPLLSNIIFASDHGYWSLALLFGFVLQTGVNVIGVLKRCDWLPFTYNNPNSKLPDKPENHDKMQYKNTYFKFCEWKNKGVNAIKNKVMAAAYCSRTGASMSLVFTSFYHGCEWNFNLKYDQDFKWYIDESPTQLQRNEKFFVELCGTLAKKIRGVPPPARQAS
jgi:hypothetical protein